MRNFWNTCLSTSALSTSAVVALALGCSNPPHLIDSGHIIPDAAQDDTNVMTVDTGMPVDTGGTLHDTGAHTGACTYGTGGCNLTDTSSCPNDASGARQGCYPDDGAPMCHPAGTAALGAHCTNGNDCDAGLVCLGTNLCAKLCCSAADCATGESCNPLADSTHTILPNGAGVCVRPTACTPTPPAGCTGTNHCYLTGADGSTDCVPSGTVAEGGNCMTDACMNGFGCYSAGTPPVFTCYRYCVIANGNTDCTSTAHPHCRAFGFGTTYGICDT